MGYIDNLMRNLICKNSYEKLLILSKSKKEFIRFVKADLECSDVREMNPETLGKIMCSFEIGDVVAIKKELFNNLHFAGDCKEFLRELVSLCLAYAIWEGLNIKETPKQ